MERERDRSNVEADATHIEATTLVVTCLRVLNTRDKLYVPEPLLDERARAIVTALASLGVQFRSRSCPRLMTPAPQPREAGSK